MSELVRKLIQGQISTIKRFNPNRHGAVEEIQNHLTEMKKGIAQYNDELKELTLELNSHHIPFKLVFQYTNYKDKTGDRTIVPERIFEGTTEYYKDKQWLISGWCLDRQDYRTFAVNQIKGIKEGDCWLELSNVMRLKDYSLQEEILKYLQQVSKQQEW